MDKQQLNNNSGAQKYKCEIFHCSVRKDDFCCFYCRRKEICAYPCLNSPKFCGKFVGEVNHNEKT